VRYSELKTFRYGLSLSTYYFLSFSASPWRLRNPGLLLRYIRQLGRILSRLGGVTLVVTTDSFAPVRDFSGEEAARVLGEEGGEKEEAMDGMDLWGLRRPLEKVESAFENFCRNRVDLDGVELFVRTVS
jgi:hypothetical protein